MEIRSIDVIGFFGRRGCGKSFLCKKVQSAFPRLFIFDSLHEYEGENEIYNFDEFCEAVKQSIGKSSFTYIIRFDIETAKKSETFEQMIRLLYYRGSVTIVIEEIQNFCTPHFIGHYLENAFLTGRHRDLSILYTTQKPSTVNKKILSQSTKIFCGGLQTRGDIFEVANFLGDVSKSISELKDRHFLFWEIGQAPKVIENSSI